jgi:hypothetical protein
MDPKLKGAHRVAVKFVTNYTPLTERVFAIRYHVVEKNKVLGGPRKFSSCETTFSNDGKGHMDQAPEPTSHVSKEEIKVTDLGKDFLGGHAETIDDEVYIFFDEE